MRIRTIEDVQHYLEWLRAQVPSVIADAYLLSEPGVDEEACQRIENALQVHLPESFCAVIKDYDLSRLEITWLRFSFPQIVGDDTVGALIYWNHHSAFADFCRQHSILEIGSLESAPVCVRVGDIQPGEIVWFDPNHERPPWSVQLAASDFTRLLIGAAIAEQLIRHSEMRKWDWQADDFGLRVDELAERILEQIADIDPRAWEAKDFWYSLVQGP